MSNMPGNNKMAQNNNNNLNGSFLNNSFSSTANNMFQTNSSSLFGNPSGFNPPTGLFNTSSTSGLLNKPPQPMGMSTFIQPANITPQVYHPPTNVQ